MPIGFKFCIAARRSRELTALLPENVMFPTLTVGPSLTLKLTETDEGGIVRTSVWMVAN